MRRTPLDFPSTLIHRVTTDDFGTWKEFHGWRRRAARIYLVYTDLADARYEEEFNGLVQRPACAAVDGDLRAFWTPVGTSR